MRQAKRTYASVHGKRLFHNETFVGTLGMDQFKDHQPYFIKADDDWWGGFHVKRITN